MPAGRPKGSKSKYPTQRSYATVYRRRMGLEPEIPDIYAHHRQRPDYDWDPITPEIQTTHPVQARQRFFEAIIKGVQTFIAVPDYAEYRVGDKLDIYEIFETAATRPQQKKPFTGRIIRGMPICSIVRRMEDRASGQPKKIFGTLILGFAKMLPVDPEITTDHTGEHAKYGYSPRQLSEVQEAQKFGEDIIAEKLKKYGSIGDLSILREGDRAVIHYWMKQDAESIAGCIRYCREMYGVTQKEVLTAITRLHKGTRDVETPILIRDRPDFYKVDLAELLLYVKQREVDAKNRRAKWEEKRKKMKSHEITDRAERNNRATKFYYTKDPRKFFGYRG